MANYTLTNKYTVSTTPVADNGTEFVTTNPEGHAISSVTFFGEDARELERDLIIASRLAAL